jgi:tetratricopeptide (TPR) repeat protein
VLLVFACYATVIVTGGWIWDDSEYVTRNPVLRAGVSEGLARIWTDPSATPQYYPIVHTSFWIETRLFPTVHLTDVAQGFSIDEPHPTGFHVTNVLLMAGTVLLFWRVLLRLSVPGAFFAAALFAVHPVNVESVAWVTERKNMLSGLFMLATALWYLRFAGIGNPDGQKARTPAAWSAALGFWILGLLSKTVIAFLPPALFLLVWWKRPEAWKRHVLPLLPFVVLGLLAGLHTARIEVDQVMLGIDYLGLSMLDRVVLAGSVVWLYFLHFIAPLQQMFFYPKWDPDPASFTQWALVLAAVVLVSVMMRSTRRMGRGPLVAVLIFGGGLVPVMGFFDVYPFRFSWVADHFQYHANFAMFALLGAALTRVPLARVARRAVAVALLVGLAVLTGKQGLVYKDQETLWRDTIDKNEESWIAYQNLGELLRERGEIDAAVANFERGIKIHPDPRLYASLAAAQLNRFDRDKDPKHLDEAIRFAEKALTMWSDFPQAHLILARSYGAKGGHVDKVIEHHEGLLAAVLDEKMHGAFLRQKLTSPQLMDAVVHLYSLYVTKGDERLAAGDAPGAFDFFRRSAEHVAGPELPPFRDLYPWTPNSPWLNLDLRRIWMLAAATDSTVRNPQQAASELQSLGASYAQRLQQAGAARGLVMSRAIEVMDLRAAVHAALGQFEDAVRVADQAVSAVAMSTGAPVEWVRGMEARRALYRKGQSFRLGDRVPLAVGQ